MFAVTRLFRDGWLVKIYFALDVEFVVLAVSFGLIAVLREA